MSSVLKTNLILLILFLFISGCATGSKTLKQHGAMKEQLPAKTSAEKTRAIQSSAEAAPPPRIAYAQITNLISEFLNIKAMDNTLAGQPRYVGVSENKLVTLEIIGDRDKAAIASIKLVYPDDIETVSADLNNAMMLRFLKNVAPENKEWSNNVKDITNKFYSLQIGQTKEEDMALQDKMIKILYDKNTASVTLTVRIRQ